MPPPPRRISSGPAGDRGDRPDRWRAAGTAVGSFEEFYAAAFQSLMLQLWAYTGDHAQARDVVQEALCRAFARWDRISRYDDPAAWVRRVAWNLATSRFRQLRSLRAFARQHRESHVPGPDPDRVALVAALGDLRHGAGGHW